MNKYHNKEERVAFKLMLYTRVKEYYPEYDDDIVNEIGTKICKVLDYNLEKNKVDTVVYHRKLCIDKLSELLSMDNHHEQLDIDYILSEVDKCITINVLKLLNIEC